MTLEPILVLWSDPAANKILLRNIWLYPIVLSVLHCLLVYFHYLDPGYQMQGCEDTVIYIL